MLRGRPTGRLAAGLMSLAVTAAPVDPGLWADKFEANRSAKANPGTPRALDPQAID
ncbi:MAG: hypothetical protein WAO08_29085 [Hyphomicrobiaceae bacterium]